MADNITGYDLPAEQETNLISTPDEAIESYDGKSSTDVFNSLLGPSQEQIQQQENIDRYYKSGRKYVAKRNGWIYATYTRRRCR